MRNYELVLVWDASLGEDRIKHELAKLRTFMEGNGAQDVLVENWGKREMAYAIDKHTHGN